MAKFFPPLGSGSVHKITNTYHGESASNPGDFSKQIAVDISATGGTPVYAVADGTIVNATASAGGYCTLDIGLPYWCLYVHTTKWLPVGTKVKRGQKIAEVMTMSGSHLHLGTKMKNSTPPKYGLMELVDRSAVFGVGFTKGSASYNEILNAWFYSDQKIKWELFADVDPFDIPVKGNRYEYLRDTNVRTAPKTSAGINGLAVQGAVGEVRESGSWYADGYEWIFLNLNSIEGYSIKKNVVRTDKPKTTPDGGSITPPPTVPPVDPCKEKVEKAVLAERVKWEAKVKDMLATIELYKKEEGEQKSAVAKLLERFRG